MTTALTLTELDEPFCRPVTEARAARTPLGQELVAVSDDDEVTLVMTLTELAGLVAGPGGRGRLPTLPSAVDAVPLSPRDRRTTVISVRSVGEPEECAGPQRPTGHQNGDE